MRGWRTFWRKREGQCSFGRRKRRGEGNDCRSFGVSDGQRRRSAGAFDKRLVSLQIGGLVAGAQPAELQERINKIIEEIKLAGNIVLYVPDVHNLVRTSGEAFLSVADVLLPAVVEGDFSVIGSTFPKEFKQFIEPRGDFSDAFEIIRVEEISEDEAERLLVYHCLLWERQYGTVVSFGAVKKPFRWRADISARNFCRRAPKNC